MITVTGNTFEHRERFKRLNGQWDADARAWQFFHLTPAQITELRGLPGCAVSEPKQRPPQPIPAAVPRERNIDTFASIAVLIQNRNSQGVDSKFDTKIYGDDQTYFNHFKDKNPAAYFGFSSLQSFADYIATIPLEKQRNGFNQDDFEDCFCLSRNMPHALRIARDGWKEGIEEAAEILQIFNVEHPTKRKRHHGVTGANVSVGRMLAGNPVHMLHRPKLPGRRIVTLFVECGMNGGVQGETMATRAILVAAIVETLEREGYSCEIVATDISMHDEKCLYQLAVRLKQAGQRLNLADLIFGLGHPSFLRRFSFAACASADECRQIWASQGAPSVMFNESYPTGKNEYYIRPITTNFAGTLRKRALRMLPFVEPANLPIKILEQN